MRKNEAQVRHTSPTSDQAIGSQQIDPCERGGGRAGRQPNRARASRDVAVEILVSPSAPSPAQLAASEAVCREAAQRLAIAKQQEEEHEARQAAKPGLARNKHSAGHDGQTAAGQAAPQIGTAGLNTSGSESGSGSVDDWLSRFPSEQDEKRRRRQARELAKKQAEEAARLEVKASEDEKRHSEQATQDDPGEGGGRLRPTQRQPQVLADLMLPAVADAQPTRSHLASETGSEPCDAGHGPALGFEKPASNASPAACQDVAEELHNAIRPDAQLDAPESHHYWHGADPSAEGEGTQAGTLVQSEVVHADHEVHEASSPVEDQAGGVELGHGWYQGWDAYYEHVYYYHLSTGASQWELPGCLAVDGQPGVPALVSDGGPVSAETPLDEQNETELAVTQTDESESDTNNVAALTADGLLVGGQDEGIAGGYPVHDNSTEANWQDENAAGTVPPAVVRTAAGERADWFSRDVLGLTDDYQRPDQHAWNHEERTREELDRQPVAAQHDRPPAAALAWEFENEHAPEGNVIEPMEQEQELLGPTQSDVEAREMREDAGWTDDAPVRSTGVEAEIVVENEASRPVAQRGHDLDEQKPSDVPHRWTRLVEQRDAHTHAFAQQQATEDTHCAVDDGNLHGGNADRERDQDALSDRPNGLLHGDRTMDEIIVWDGAEDAPPGRWADHQDNGWLDDGMHEGRQTQGGDCASAAAMQAEGSGVVSLEQLRQAERQLQALQDEVERLRREVKASGGVVPVSPQQMAADSGEHLRNKPPPAVDGADPLMPVSGTAEMHTISDTAPGPNGIPAPAPRENDEVSEVLRAMKATLSSLDDRHGDDDCALEPASEPEDPTPENAEDSLGGARRQGWL